jgi:hypothetical protein
MPPIDLADMGKSAIVRFAPKAEVGNLERIECPAYED